MRSKTSEAICCRPVLSSLSNNMIYKTVVQSYHDKREAHNHHLIPSHQVQHSYAYPIESHFPHTTNSKIFIRHHHAVLQEQPLPSSLDGRKQHSQTALPHRPNSRILHSHPAPKQPCTLQTPTSPQLKHYTGLLPSAANTRISYRMVVRQELFARYNEPDQS